MKYITKISQFVLCVIPHVIVLSSANAQSASPLTDRSGDQTPYSAEDVIPPDFRGRITYDGSLDGTATVQNGSTTANVFGFRVSSPNMQKIPIRAAVHTEVEYDHEMIRGSTSYRGSVSANFNFTGRRHGAQCDYIDSDDGLRTSGLCTFSMLKTDAEYDDTRGRHFLQHIQADRTSMVDFAVRDREQAVAAQALQAKVDERLSRKLTPLEARVETAIEIDSARWILNRFDKNSVSLISHKQITRAELAKYKDLPADLEAVVANYTYNNGRPGTVNIGFSKGSVFCIQFFDEPQCRPLGQPHSHIFAGLMMSGMIQSMMSSGSESGRGEVHNCHTDPGAACLGEHITIGGKEPD